MPERPPRPDLGPCPGESPFLGCHHATFTTRDMNRTVMFYTDVLGLPLVATARGEAPDGTPCRRYWFDAGGGSTLLFIERPDAAFIPPGTSTSARDPPGHVVAFSFKVDGEDDLVAVQERLVQSGVDVTPVEDRGLWKCIRFTDPNGLTVEVAYWKAGEFPDYKTAFRDPDPVPALRMRAFPP